MNLANEIKMVLELEREGKERLASARKDAEKILEEAREGTRCLVRETDREIARLKEEETAQVEEELAREIQELRKRTAAEKERLRALSDKNREKAVESVLGWLREER